MWWLRRPRIYMRAGSNYILRRVNYYYYYNYYFFFYPFVTLQEFDITDDISCNIYAEKEKCV